MLAGLSHYSIRGARYDDVSDGYGAVAISVAAWNIKEYKCRGGR